MPISRQPDSSAKPGSLTHVVQSLVRAQYGLTANEAPNSGPSTPNGSSSKGKTGETETDLDRHVADLLLKEAKEREERAKKENIGYWRLSDDEGCGPQALLTERHVLKQVPREHQYQSRTNKRFLKTIIQNVEDHNKPLIRAEGISRKEDLDAIRARDRAERERRTGVKDAERSHRRNGNDTEDTGPESSRTTTAPGFAARSLAIGFNGARNAKREEDRKRKAIDAAITKARDRAADDQAVHRSDKGKRRAADQNSDADPRPDRERRLRPRQDRSKEAGHRDDRGEASHSSRSRRPRGDSEDDEHSRRYAELRAQHFHELTEVTRRRRPHSDDRSHCRRSASPERYDDHQKSRSSKDRSLRAKSSSSRRTGGDRRSHRSGDEHERKRECTPECNSESEASSSDTFIDTTDVGPVGNGSKMDKYFTSAYNPALDVSFDDLTDPSTGLIGEGNFSEWDKMLHILRKRKEDRAFGVTQAREEERERQLHKLEKKKRKEEREARRALRKDKKGKKRRRDDESDSEVPRSGDEGVGSKMRSEGGTVRVGDYEYGRRGTVRAWDMGKDAA